MHHRKTITKPDKPSSIHVHVIHNIKKTMN